MKPKIVWIGLLVILFGSCLNTNSLSNKRENAGNATEEANIEISQLEAKENPIIGTWRLVPGQSGGEYWPKPCREIRFSQRASYCGDTGDPNSYEVQGHQVMVYDDNFEQIYRFPDQNTMTTNVAGVGTLEFTRIK